MNSKELASGEHDNSIYFWCMDQCLTKSGTPGRDGFAFKDWLQNQPADDVVGVAHSVFNNPLCLFYEETEYAHITEALVYTSDTFVTVNRILSYDKTTPGKEIPDELYDITGTILSGWAKQFVEFFVYDEALRYGQPITAREALDVLQDIEASEGLEADEF